MELELVRFRSTEKSTIGSMESGGQHLCFTLEPRDRGLTSAMSVEEILKIKKPGETAIPVGRYKIGLIDSPKHGPDTLLFEGVLGFVYVEVHSGNTSIDTKACILPGVVFGVDRVDSSRKASGDLKAILVPLIKSGEEVWVTVKRNYSVAV